MASAARIISLYYHNGCCFNLSLPTCLRQIAKTVKSVVKEENYKHVNRALAEKMSSVPLLTEEDVKVLKGVEPVLTTFSDICDAAGQFKSTISQWPFYLSRLWEVSKPAAGEPKLVTKYKNAIQASLAVVGAEGSLSRYD